MSLSAPALRIAGFRTGPVLWMVGLALAVALFAASDFVPWVAKYPRGWVIPLHFWISDFMKWLINDATFGLFTFKELTRSFSWLLNQPHTFTEGLLHSGFVLVLDENDDPLYTLARLSWVAVIAIVVLLGHYARDWKLALLVGGCFLYLAVFGQWDSAMETLSSIIVAVFFGVALGLFAGIAAFRSERAEAVITPILDLMQTVPVFAYLVSVLFLFGFTPVSAMIATIIYATPPMVRCTVLALRTVPTEIVEFGNMTGCSRRQLLWKVMIPAARPTLMVGVNQVIMLSLNMVIIASMIGAGGLGWDVLTSLKRQWIGQGLEAGIAIVLLAIALDRLGQAFVTRAPPGHEEARKSLLNRHPYLVIGLFIVASTMLLGAVMPALQVFPESLTVTTGPLLDDLVSYIVRNFFDQIYAVKSFLLINAMIPFKRFLLSIPWPAVVALVALGGYQLGGWRLAALVAGFTLFIAVTGNWPKAMISVYLCGISVVIASLIGMPIGVWAARNDRAHRVVQVAIDTLQTLPSFVYLIPMVMLFQVGDFSAMIAVIVYALSPVIRYTDHGIRQVPSSIIEAARAAGCSRRQILWRVQIPLALPEIMLGVNQTVMMALSMLVITALIGTNELGQEVYIALTKADTGRGIVAGVCVAFIAMTVDRLISAWSTRKKRELGIV